MRVAFFEDDSTGGLAPIALLRPVFELLCGQFSLRERILRRLDVHEWGALIRPQLADVYRDEQPECRINDAAWLRQAPTLLINGRWLPSLKALAEIQPNQAGMLDDEIVYVTCDEEGASRLEEICRQQPADARPSVEEAMQRIAARRRMVETGGRLIRYPWDLVNHNAEQLLADFRLRNYSRSGFQPGQQVAVLGAAEDVFIDRNAQIDPFVVIDARTGPVSIEAGAVVQPFTRIEGPCHVGRGAQLFRANVREATTIGPVCRIGGEVEASILHGHANKYHDGFLGHGYVCPWVNLGALTTNSDLKNDYSAVRVPLAGTAVETGTNKVGCFVGDHTKTALGSLFNTGSSIGVMCMVLPAGELLPKHIPSFSRIWHGVPDDGLELEAGIKTARIAMGRRNVELTEAQERLLRQLHAETQAERDAAIDRFRRRSESRRAEDGDRRSEVGSRKSEVG